MARAQTVASFAMWALKLLSLSVMNPSSERLPSPISVRASSSQTAGSGSSR